MAFIQPIHAPPDFLPSSIMASHQETKLPMLFHSDQYSGAMTFAPRLTSHVSDWSVDSIALRPITSHSEQTTQLPSIQHIVASMPSLSTNSSTSLSTTHGNVSPFPSPYSSIASFDDVASRKSSIASLLNSEPEDEPVDELAVMSSLKRGRSRQTYAPAKKLKCQQQLQPKQQPAPATDNGRSVKGLRHFSKQVCDKVAERGVTTYNEVADELANEIRTHTDTDAASCDQKNIRRRVYDALNVLMAMGIIAKEKKQIRWLGIPSEFQRHPKVALQKQIALEEQRQDQLTLSVHEARAAVGGALQRYLQLRHLAWRNQRQPSKDKIGLPLVAVACPSVCDIDISSDGREAVISAQEPTEHDKPLTVYRDADVLTWLQFNHMSTRQLSSWLPQQAWRQQMSIQPLDDTMCVVQADVPVTASMALAA